MFHLILASSFVGLEIMFFLPVLGIAALVGFISTFFRARPLAIICGIICGVTGAIALWSASYPLPDSIRLIEAVLGLIGIGVATVLCIYKRKKK